MEKKFHLQILISLLRFSLISMLNNDESQDYFLDTCCSLNENENIFISCSSNEILHLNLIELFYNSNPFCSIESSCCQIRTACSRRLTKYSSLNCDGKQFCFINKTCLQIYSSCTNYQSLYGQYLTIRYSCLNIQQNQTDDQDETVLVHLLTTETKLEETVQLKSSPIFLILIIFIFLCFMLIIYWLAHLFGKKYCEKRTNLENHFIYLNKSNEKQYVQSNYSIPTTKIYPKINSFYPYRTLINVQHDPFTGQVYSRTFYPHFNSYQ